MKSTLALSLAATILAGSPAVAQIAVMVADGKQLRPDDDVPGVTPDEVSILDLGSYPPRVLATVSAPTSITGPAGTVAVARDGQFAIFTASQRIDPADPGKLLSDDLVSLVDLREPASPRVSPPAHAAMGAGGVTLNAEGSLALVASAEANAVTAFAVTEGALTRVAQIELPKGALPSAIAFTPDGRRALVVRRGDSRISIIDVTGASVTLSPVEITPGRTPYGVSISPDGAHAFVSNLGGAATRAEIDAPPPPSGAPPPPRRPGTVSVLDLRTDALVNSVEVGATPEAMALSADGTMLAVVVANGASVQKLAANYDSTSGLLRLFAVEGAKLTPLDTVRNGHWCQGVVFSDDGKTLLVTCGAERHVEVYRIEEGRLLRD